MGSLADLVNDKQQAGYRIFDELKKFCEKWDISPHEIEIIYNVAGVLIKVKV
jgi:hypothetical protein